MHDRPSSNPQRPQPEAPIRALRLGDLLVRQGLLTPQQVGHILDVQAATARPFGDLAERLFGVKSQAVADAWVEQFCTQCGEHDVTQERCEPWCIQMVDRRQAWQFRVVPMRREEGHLLVATERGGLLRAVNFAQQTLPLAPCVVLATTASLRAVLMKHYPVPPHLADFAFAR